MSDILELLDDLQELINDLNNPNDVEKILDFIDLQRSIYGGARGECAS